MRTDAHSLGLMMAILLAGAQLVWVLLVALGWAQGLVDFLMMAWFFAPTLKIMPFDFLHALVLVFGTGVVGYLLGWSVGVTLNSAQRIHE